MARRKNSKVTVPTTFVGTFYDTEAGVYVASRKDGSLTVGKMNTRGLNVEFGGVFPGADATTLTEH